MVKRAIFVVLAIAAAFVGVVAYKTSPRFAGDLWSDLFWLIASVISTTFLLDSILERSSATRRKREDQFASVRLESYNARYWTLQVIATWRKDMSGSSRRVMKKCSDATSGCRRWLALGVTGMN